MNPILAHFVGDYLLQNDWMAQNKKLNSWVCLIHVLAYLAPFWFCNLSYWQIVLIGIQHFLQDRTNFILWLMKIKGSEVFATGPCSPWSIIVTDNIVHIIFIAIITQIKI
jgi:hypothetical protein